jgi:tyrosyl-tRNA synthetase
MYPILQGYDSVVVKADVELGAIEQKFNLLMGRKIQKLLGQPEQNVIMMSYLTGTDGREKMSKSLGNTINLNDRPEDIYGKVMSIPDNLIIEYFTLCTDLTDKALEVVKDEVKVKPKEAKAQLAFLITETLYDTIQAEQAKERFDLIHRQHRLPQNIKQVRVNRSMPLGEIVARSGLVTSRSEAERVIIQGGVMLDNRVIKDWRKTITVSDGQVLKVGKRRFARLRV